MGPVTHEQIINFLLFFPILLISIALHEFAHCWSSDRLGDDTPRRLGRVTLNPLKHLDPLGTLMMAFTAFVGFGFGWGKSSPFNPVNFRHPARDRMLTALAGPMSNILQMLVWASLGAVLQDLLGRSAVILLALCYIGVIINASLAVFNLLPIYPLDGHHILSYLAPPAWRPIIDNRNWSYVFLALVLYQPLRDSILHPVLIPMMDGLQFLAKFLTGWSIL